MHHKNTRRRLTSDSKGFSSIVGALFAVLVMFYLTSTLFVWTLSQNTDYNNAVREQNQLDLSRISEKLQVLDTGYTANANSTATVVAHIQNIGSSSVQFTTLWICVSNTTWTKYNSSNLVNANVQPGKVFRVNINLEVTGINSTYSYNFVSWLITFRGNSVPLQKSTLTTNIVVSQTTQGIGALMFNFTNFSSYKVRLEQGSYYVNFSSQTSGYLVKANDAPVGFVVTLTNLDTEDIILNYHSEFFSILPFTGGAYQAVTWYIVNVDPETGLIKEPFANVVIPHPASGELIPTTVYFASKDPAQTSFTPLPQNKMAIGTCPVNLALVGTKGSMPFGQNIPFVSLYVS